MTKIEFHEGGRIDFIENLRRREARTGVEVGVYNGENAAVLCRTVPTLHTLYCVDPYTTDIDGYEDYANDPQEVQNCRARLVQALIDWGGIRGELVRHTSREAAEMLVKKAPFDFVYIDANHDLQHVREDIALWAPLIRSGGIVSGHDFCIDYLDSVVDAVMRSVDNSAQQLHVFKRDDIWCFVKE